MLDLAGNTREQTDTRITDAPQMPCLKRQKPLQIKALSVSFFILVLSIATERERKEGRRARFMLKGSCQLEPNGSASWHKIQKQWPRRRRGYFCTLDLPWLSRGGEEVDLPIDEAVWPVLGPE